MPDKNNKIYYAIITIIIVGCLIAAGLYTYFENLNKDEKPDHTGNEIIDDRISPYMTQGIVLKIHRMRRNGIIDQMENSGLPFIKNLIFNLPFGKYENKIYIEGMRPGYGWDEKPSFSYIVQFDDFEEVSRVTYNDWDTGYINELIFKKVEEEQPTTEVKFTIMENVKTKKLFKTTTSKVAKEEFCVTYDYRTGRWDGDDYFNDSDGYGHINGENYEIWFTLTQTTPDEDNIPFWTEVNVLKTDPLKDDGKLDPDGDGIPTEWEWRWGYDPMTWDNHSELDPDLDGLQNDEEYFMEEWLANPYHQDIYIEVDNMAPTPKKFRDKDGWDGWVHEFYYESQQMLIERFSQHNICVHIDDGRMDGGGDTLPFARGGGAYEQDAGVVAGHYANDFADERKGIFRYLIVAYGGGWCHPQDENHWYDCMVIPHNKRFYTNLLGNAAVDRTKRIALAVSVMHELGHSLGLNRMVWAGVDNASSRNPDDPDYPWLDYASCMNYDYFWYRSLDYSDGTHGEYDFDDWSYIDLTFFQTPSKRMEGLGS